MRRTKWARALRPIPILAVLGVALAGCGGGLGSGRYGGGYYGGGPGYYGSPYYGGYGAGPFGGYNRYRAPRGYYGGGYGGAPRRENWSQDRLRQHWMEQARRAR